MRALLLELIGLAMLQTLMLLFIRTDALRNLVKLIGGVAMVLVLLSRVIAFDFAAYSSAIQSQMNSSALDGDALREQQDRLNRLYIEQECAAYILGKAEQLCVPLRSASVTLAWNTDGYWYPIHAVLTVSAGQAPSAVLEDTIQTDLGIPASEQVWQEEGR